MTIAGDVPAPIHQLWRVRLFEGPVLESTTGDVVRHFRSQRVGAMLAYLALRLGRCCPREELALALWPEEEDPQIVANRLRVTLASLRRQLELPGVPFGSVLDVSQPGLVTLREETVWCDVIALNRALKRGDRQEAARLLRGTLLPGYFDDWAHYPRERFANLWKQLQDVAVPLPPTETSQQKPLETTALANPTSVTFPLPLYLTRFFGREKEQQALCALLQTHRLVTITGIGGMGKTRLAVETAQKIPLPCLFTALADKDQGEFLAQSILRDLRADVDASQPALGQLIAVLRQQSPLLLLLDNAEHLLDAVATLALQLLRDVPELRILVTSRQCLNVAGEALLPLSALDMPCDATAPECLLASPSAALFVDRAQKARPDFVPSPRYIASIVQICRLLEGTPLGLELASARVTMQTPAQIAEELTQSVTELRSRQRGLSKRHQSLRATVQGSFALLSADLQAFYAALTVFRGGWTVEAARAITGNALAEEYLEELRTRSLLTAQEDARLNVMRYSFQEVLRQFAAEMLPPEERELLAARHAQFYCDWARAVHLPNMRYLCRLTSDHENLLLALEWYWEQDRKTLQEVLGDILILWANQGEYRVALEWIRRMDAEISGPRTREQIGIHLGACRVLTDLGRFEEAEARAYEVLEHKQTYAELEIMAWRALGHIAYLKQDLTQSETLLRKSLKAAENHSLNSPLIHLGRIMLASVLLARAEASTGETACALFAEAEALLHSIQELMEPYHRYTLFFCLSLARARQGKGHFREADACLENALQFALQYTSRQMLFMCLTYASQRALRQRDYREAVSLLVVAETLRESTGYAPDPAALRTAREIVRSLREVLGEETYLQMRAEAGSVSLEDIARRYVG
jgi:predicted ATPase